MNHLLIYLLMNVQVGVSCKWTHDSQQFLLEHFDTICESPSQIYHSALPFCPPTTWLQECYHSEFSQEVKVVKGLSAGWGIWSHTVSLGTYVYEISYFNNTVAIGSGHRDIIILDAITGNKRTILSGHTDEVLSVAFSSDGRLLVSGSGDKTIKLWDMQTGGATNTLSGHTEVIRSVSISVDCATIASGSFDQTVRLWDTCTGECHHIIKQQSRVHSMKFSPTDPQLFLFVSGYTIWQWSIGGYQVGPSFEGVYADFSPDGTQTVSRYRKVAMVQNSSSRVIMVEFPVVQDNTQRCCFSPDGRLIAVSAGNTTYIWDITNSEPHLVETVTGHTDTIKSLTFSSPSSLISGSVDGSVKFWKIGAWLKDLVRADPKSIPPTPATIMSITLQVKDGIYITSDSDGEVRICDIFTGLCKTSFQTPAKGTDKRDIQAVNGRLILAWHTDRKIKIWDIEKAELLLMIDGPRYFEDIKISGDGSRVLSIGARVIQAQSMQTGEVVGKAEIEFVDANTASLTVHGSRVWVHHPDTESQVWDFGIPDSHPAQLLDAPLHILHPTGAILWDAGLSCVKDNITGRVVFQLSKRHGRPVNVCWNNQYLVASFISGEVLILDFSHIFPL